MWGVRGGLAREVSRLLRWGCKVLGWISTLQADNLYCRAEYEEVSLF